MKLRKILFWLHLCAGVVAGIVILVMCVTGAAIAFEKEIVSGFEENVRTVSLPAGGGSPLSLDELLDQVRAKRSGARPSAVTVFADPHAAVLVSFGRTNACYANPYTGEISAQGAAAARTFMQVMTDWHRWLGRTGEGRAVGKAMTGAGNVAFLFLAISGLYLWWPRQGSWTALKGIVVFNLQLRGKARDWNWHNVIGIWSAPALVILTATATVISYRWASDMVYTITGSPLPAAGSGPGTLSASATDASQPPAGTKPLAYGALVAAAKQATPNWDQVSIRFGGPSPRSERSGESAGGPQPISVTVRERNGWPLFANVQLSLDPFTGAVLKKETFADYNTGRKVRTWMRFLHTGEALGFTGKLIAALASVGGAILVWTGVALASRRFVAWRRKPARESAPTATREAQAP